MTDIEISRALALAIGWPRSRVAEGPNFMGTSLYCYVQYNKRSGEWRKFDYHDPAVIWPIAERYFAFPSQYVDSYGRCVAWEASVYIEKTNKSVSLVKADTAAKAVALAVIRSKT